MEEIQHQTCPIDAKELTSKTIPTSELFNAQYTETTEHLQPISDIFHLVASARQQFPANRDISVQNSPVGTSTKVKHPQKIF